MKEPEATESAHVEQLVQQQSRVGAPVHFTCVSASPHVHDQHGLCVYTTATDDAGALWERWSFWEPGHWEEVPRPTR